MEPHMYSTNAWRLWCLFHLNNCIIVRNILVETWKNNSLIVYIKFKIHRQPDLQSSKYCIYVKIHVVGVTFSIWNWNKTTKIEFLPVSSAFQKAYGIHCNAETQTKFDFQISQQPCRPKNITIIKITFNFVGCQ